VVTSHCNSVSIRSTTKSCCVSPITFGCRLAIRYLRTWCHSSPGSAFEDSLARKSIFGHIHEA